MGHYNSQSSLADLMVEAGISGQSLNRSATLQGSNYAIAMAGGAQSMPASANTLMTFTGYDDAHGMVVSSNQIRVNKTGLWEVSLRAVMLITAAGTSTFTANVLKNASGVSGAPGGSILMNATAFNWHVMDSAPMQLAAGDLITVQVQHNTSTAGTINGTSRLAVSYQGPMA